MALKDTLQRLQRGFERWTAGESNKTVHVTSGYFSGAGGHFFSPTAIAVDKLVNPTQLEFESSGAILSGPRGDVSAVRCLDKVFSRLVLSGTAPVPEETVDAFRAHVGDLALKGVFDRVSARRPDGAPAKTLTYAISYRDGKSQRVQEIASVGLGG